MKYAKIAGEEAGSAEKRINEAKKEGKKNKKINKKIRNKNYYYGRKGRRITISRLDKRDKTWQGRRRRRRIRRRRRRI